MHDKQLFEYAVIRVVPRVEREEFLNVGVVLYCRGRRYLQFVYELDEPRLHALSPSLDMHDLKRHLEAFRNIVRGEKVSSPIAALDIASRFRWLTATRSTIVQSSKVHPGLCEDPEKLIERLLDQFVRIGQE